MPSLLAQWTVVGKTGEFSVRDRDMTLWFSTVFPSCLKILIWPCVYSFCLFLSPLSLSLAPALSLTPLSPSSHAHFPHFSVTVPGCWHNTDGPGSGKDVNLRERCLLWDFHCREETRLVFLFALSHSVIAHWNLFFKLWKVPVSANCCSVYRCWSRRWMLCAHSQKQSLLLTLYRLHCGIWQWACCAVD